MPAMYLQFSSKITVHIHLLHTPAYVYTPADAKAVWEAWSLNPIFPLTDGKMKSQ
jgi:hypothetical protein